jgi:hypothetical protein
MKCSSSLATSYAVLALVVLAAVSIPSGTEAYTVRFGSTITRGNVSPSSVRSAEKSSSTASTTITSSSATTTMMRMLTDETPDPSTFREAEVLGLRLMQEGSFQEALVGMLLSLLLLLLTMMMSLNLFLPKNKFPNQTSCFLYEIISLSKGNETSRKSTGCSSNQGSFGPQSRGWSLWGNG